MGVQRNNYMGGGGEILSRGRKYFFVISFTKRGVRQTPNPSPLSPLRTPMTNNISPSANSPLVTINDFKHQRKNLFGLFSKNIIGLISSSIRRSRRNNELFTVMIDHLKDPYIYVLPGAAKGGGGNRSNALPI